MQIIMFPLTEEEKLVFMDNAWKMALDSKCLKKKVGAVLVDSVSLEVVSVGYGGASRPCEVCLRKTVEWQGDGCWSIHAEMRAILFYLKHNNYDELTFHNFVMFTTHGPCDACIKLCEYLEIPLIVYDTEYHNDYSKWNGLITIERFKRNSQ